MNRAAGNNAVWGQPGMLDELRSYWGGAYDIAASLDDDRALDTAQEQVRARAAVQAWRDEHPEGTAEQLVAALDRDFHREYDVVLRRLLFAYDRHRAHQITGVTTPAAEVGR